VARYTSLMGDPAYAALPFQRLRSHEDSERFLRGLDASLPDPVSQPRAAPLSA
jgi:hypothetical protein